MKISLPYSFDELRSLLYTTKEIKDMIIFISTKSTPSSYFSKLWRS